MVRLTREESRARTIGLLLKAAMETVAEQGYDGASVTDIAERAGFSKGAFFANFESKEAMLLALLRRNFDQELMMLSQLVEAMQNSETAIAVLDKYFTLLDSDPSYVKYNMHMLQYANRTPSFAGDYFALFDAYRDALGNLVQVFFDKMGKQPPLPPKEIGDQLIALSHGLVLQQKASISAPLRVMLVNLLAVAQSIDKAQE